MNTLEKIILHKKQEVELRKAEVPSKELEKSIFLDRENISLKKFLLDPQRSGIISEFKRRSPSKGLINGNVQVTDVVKKYEEAGASAISVLTDTEFFGGKNQDLVEARNVVEVPLLRKDFIIDEYQILEAKALGANIILLIAAALDTVRIKELSSFSRSLGLEVLLEVHDQDELMVNLYDTIDVIGVNNRNLKDFSVSLETSMRLAELIPDSYIKISESGIYDVNDIITLRHHGFQGFLIGENFMREEDPGEAMKRFTSRLKEEIIKSN